LLLLLPEVLLVLSTSCLKLAAAINMHRQQQEQQWSAAHSSHDEQQIDMTSQQRQQQQVLLPASYLKLAKRLLQQWRTLVQGMRAKPDFILDSDDFGPTVYAVAALGAAVVHAWPAAAAAAAAEHGSSSSAADFDLHTSAAHLAMCCAQEQLAPALTFACTKPVVLDLHMSDDVLLLLIANLALVSRHTILQQQEQQQQEQQQQHKQHQQQHRQQQQGMPNLQEQPSFAAHEQLFHAVGLGGVFQQLPAAAIQQQQQQGLSYDADDLRIAVDAMRRVTGTRVDLHYNPAMQALLVAQRNEQPPAVQISLAAVWQPLLQVVLQLPLSAAALGVKRDEVTIVLMFCLQTSLNVFESVAAELLQDAAGSTAAGQAAVDTFVQQVGEQVMPDLLGRLGTLALQQRWSAREAKRAGAVWDGNTDSSSSRLDAGNEAGSGSGSRGGSSSRSGSHKSAEAPKQQSKSKGAHVAASNRAGSSSSSNRRSRSGSQGVSSSSSSSKTDLVSSSRQSKGAYLVDAWADCIGRFLTSGEGMVV
jgi:hypothetical protein